MSLDPEEAYAQYTADPSPEKMRAVVHALKPLTSYHLSSINAANDPYLQAKASVLTAQAIPRFDPSRGVALKTFISHQLMPLRRLRRQSQMPVRIPERTQLDALHLKQKEQEFFDRNDRSPDALELADFSGFSVPKIEKLRRAFRPMPSEGAFGENSSSVQRPSFDAEALRYIHGELGHIDRRILEHRMGYGGAEVLPLDVLGKRLNLSASQVSRRAASISLKIAETEGDLEKAYG